MKEFLVIALLLLCSSLTGQTFFTEVNSTWDDRYDEWEIRGFDNEEEFELQLSLLWPFRNNWEEWRVTGTLYNGSIKTKWRGDPGQWELRINEDIVLVSQLSRGNMNRWEIRQGSQRTTLSTQSRGNPFFWHQPGHRNQWQMWVAYTNDPRDWIIEDYMDEKQPLSMRLAMIFITLWLNIPKG